MYDVIGYVGVSIYLISYMLLSMKKINGNGRPYLLCNLFAASFVVVSLIENFNAPSFAIQSCWIVLSIIGLIKMTFFQEKE
jgi:hypothetical protein